jgi:hypothetical protein
MMKIFLHLIVFSSLVLSVSCTPKNEVTSKNDSTKINNYKYVTILSSQQTDAKLQMYDKNGNLLDSKKLKVNGVDENGSAYLNGPQYTNGKWYLGVASDSKCQDFILELDPSTLDVKQFPANIGDQYQYTGYTVDKDILYTFYSTTKGTHIVKSRISDSKILTQTNIENTILLHLIPKDNYLILISDSGVLEKPELHIRIIDKETLKIVKEFKKEDYSFVRDVVLDNNKIYMVPFLDKNEPIAKQLLIFDLIKERWDIVQLPFNNSRYLNIVNNKLYISEQNTATNSHSMAIMNLENREIEEIINYDYVAREVIFDKDAMITCSDNKVYVYNLKTLDLMDEFDIKNSDDLMFGSLLVKP